MYKAFLVPLCNLSCTSLDAFQHDVVTQCQGQHRRVEASHGQRLDREVTESDEMVTECQQCSLSGDLEERSRGEQTVREIKTDLLVGQKFKVFEGFGSASWIFIV